MTKHLFILSIIVITLSCKQKNIELTLNKTEKEFIMEKYKIINEKQLPEISRFDPVASAIGLRPGELCEITRPSTTSITSKYYRLCK